MAVRSASTNLFGGRGDRSKAVILDVATKLMSARGYDGTSISAIAAESGLPASSIYHHFSSKLGILTAVIERGRRRFQEEMAVTAFPPSRSHLENVTELLKRAQHAIERSPEFVQLQFVILLNSPAGSVNEAVAQARIQERKGLWAGLEAAFADLGELTAGRVADEVGGFVTDAFDGIQIGRFSGSTSTDASIRQLAQATVALADALLDSGTHRVAPMETERG